MSHFKQSLEFEKEFRKLSKKYPSLKEDLERLEKVLQINPTGLGSNFIIMHHSPKAKIVKTRLACKSLRDRSIRVIYAYHESITTFVHIEIYFKGDKENEDRDRIKKYLEDIKV